MPVAGTELNILCTESANFKRIDSSKKAIFRLFLNSQNQLTLAIWTTSGTEYDVSPLLTLTVRELSGFKWTADTFFGDQKIGSNRIRKIEDEIDKQHTSHAIFVPRLHDVFINQIAFDINIGNVSDALSFVSMGLTNPSPPRNAKTKD